MLKAEYTHGNIAVIMLKTAAAMLASTLAMSGYNIADTFFVGLLGEKPLAAMGFTFPTIMLAGCIFAGFGSGCMAIMAQAIGQGDTKTANRIVTSGMLLLTLLSLLIGGCGILFADQLFTLLGAQGETLTHLKSYMNVWFAGCLTAGIAMKGNNLLIAAGRPRLASALTIVGMLVNVILDPLFILGGEGLHIVINESGYGGGIIDACVSCFAFVPAQGIRGAALATVISQAISAVTLLIVLNRVGLLSFQRIPAAKLLQAWRRIAAYAIPSIMGMLLMPVTSTITTWVTGQFGDTLVAAVAAASRIEMTAFVLPMAFGIPLMSIIAQNYGARLYSRVRYAFYFSSITAFAVLAISALILYFGIDRISVYFTDVPDIRALMGRYMRFIVWGFGVLELSRYSGFVLTGTGHPRLDAVLKAVRMLCILIPLSLLAHFLDWQDGVFWARLAADVIGGGACFITAWYILRKLPREDGAEPQQ